MSFRGFSPATIAFLKGLAANNNKEWFDLNRQAYEEFLLKPLKLLAADLGPVVGRIDSKTDTSPQINRTVSKIYRDVRFSPDKSPFRTDQWVSYKRPTKFWGNVPEFFMYFTPEEYHIGMGFYQAEPATMERFRRHIDEHPGRFEKIVRQFRRQNDYVLTGDDYRKKIASQHSEIIQEWYQKRNFFTVYECKIGDRFYSAGLKQEIEEGFNLNAELYSFIIEGICNR